MFQVTRDDDNFYTARDGQRVVMIAPHMKNNWYVVFLGKEEEGEDLFLTAVSVHATRYAADRMAKWIISAADVFFQGIA